MHKGQKKLQIITKYKYTHYVNAFLLNLRLFYVLHLVILIRHFKSQKCIRISIAE